MAAEERLRGEQGVDLARIEVAWPSEEPLRFCFDAGLGGLDVEAVERRVFSLVA